jgi:hypothetical protein
MKQIKTEPYSVRDIGHPINEVSIEAGVIIALGDPHELEKCQKPEAGDGCPPWRSVSIDLWQ